MIEVSTYLKVGTLAFLMVFTILIWEILQHNQSDPVDAVEHHGNGRQGRYDHGGRALLSSEGSKYSAASKLGGDLIMCGASVKEAYNKSPTHISGGKSLEWCKQMQENYEVILGRSWGHLPKNMQKIWDGSKCNELLKRGNVNAPGCSVPILFRKAIFFVELSFAPNCSVRTTLLRELSFAPNCSIRTICS